MKKCPVCAVEVEDTAPFCNICGVNLAGAKDVGPSNVETPVTKEESTKTVSPVSSPHQSLPEEQSLVFISQHYNSYLPSHYLAWFCIIQQQMFLILNPQ